MGRVRVHAQLVLPNLGIDIYAQIEGNWSRLLGVSATVRLDLTLQVENGQTITINIEPPNLDLIEIGYTELLEADDVPQLLEVVLDLAVAGLADSTRDFDFSLDGLVNMATNLPSTIYRSFDSGWSPERLLGDLSKIRPPDAGHGIDSIC